MDGLVFVFGFFTGIITALVATIIYAVESYKDRHDADNP